jgi:hypothetical protein
MFRFGHSSHSSCICGDLSEDSRHLIYDCPQYARQRATLISTLALHNLSWPLLPSAILTSKNSFLLFLQFITDMKRPLFF